MADERHTIIRGGNEQQMAKRGTWLVAALLISLTLSLLIISPVHAHGGEGDEITAPPALWMMGMMYGELLLIPIVGLWLARKALAAWRPTNHNLHVDFRIRTRDFLDHG